MENNHYKEPKYPIEYEHDDEIDFIALAKTLWNGRKTILKVTGIFMVLGLFVALSSAPQYTATTVIRPILSSSKSILSGGLGSLAAMAGINLGSGGSSSAELPPSLYPQIIGSFSFQKTMFETQLNISGFDESVSYTDYYTTLQRVSLLQTLKKYTIGLPGLLIGAFKSSSNEEGKQPLKGINTMSAEELGLVGLLKNQLSLDINEKEGYISLSATLPEALAATQLLLNAQAVLQQAVIAFKIKKATEDLDFTKELYAEKKVAFEKTQANLARYRDANRNVNSALAKTVLEHLESEYRLAFSVYAELAKQVEIQKIQVKEDTPVFAVLQEAVVPLKKTSISKSFTLIIWTFLGGVLGIGLVLGKPFLLEMKVKWNREN